MKGIHIFLAEGFEETEALATLDVLRRAGLSVRTVSIANTAYVTGSHGVKVEADCLLRDLNPDGEVSESDVMLFPGGMPGTKNLAAHAGLMGMMSRHYEAGGTVAAICAAPGLVASQLPGLEGKMFTCYDGFEGPMIAKGAQYLKLPAVSDGNLITGRGAGCAIDFALAIVEQLCGKDAVARVRAGLMI